MKTPSKLLLVLTAAAALAFAYPGKANLITNGGFETGDFTGWTQSGNTGFTGVAGELSGALPHSGNFCAYFGPVGDHGFITQNLATTPGGSYVIDFWLANNGGTPSFFGVSWGGTTLYSVTDASGFGYTEFTFNVTALSGITALQFEFRQDPSYFFLDDISVTPTGVGVPDAGSTLPLLGCALLGLATLRRRLSW
jgi:hypothetical protein